MTATPDPRWHTLGAFRGCDAHDHEHGINYAAMMEWTGPDAVNRILEIAEREGIWCALRDDDGYHHEHCYAVLDIRSADGDILDDWCIPTCEAFAWWSRAVELRPDMSDCPIDTPDVYAATYEFVEAATAGLHVDAAAALLTRGGAL